MTTSRKMAFELTADERDDVFDDSAMSCDLCQFSKWVNELYLASGGDENAVNLMKRCARKIYKEKTIGSENLDTILTSYDPSTHILLCKELLVQTIINQSSDIALSNALKAVISKHVDVMNH